MLRTTVRYLGDVTIFRCEGQIVFPDADNFRNAVLMHPRIRLAVLDLAEVVVIDAAGLGMLVSLLPWSRATGTTLKLMNLNPRVEGLLELTHLMPLFEVCSVADMFELFCHASQQSRYSETEAATAVPASSLDGTRRTSIEAQR